nr:uncharacterized protein LOC110086012 [Pogona vitticeps]
MCLSSLRLSRISTFINPLSYLPFFRRLPVTWNAFSTFWMLGEHWFFTSSDLRLSANPRDCLFLHNLPHRGSLVSAQTISKWIVATICLAYQLENKPLPAGIKAHSTRALVTSTAFLRGVSVPDICRSDYLQICHMVHTVHLCLALSFGSKGKVRCYVWMSGFVSCSSVMSLLRTEAMKKKQFILDKSPIPFNVWKAVQKQLSRWQLPGDGRGCPSGDLRGFSRGVNEV